MSVKKYLCLRKLWRPMIYSTFFICFLILNLGNIFERTYSTKEENVVPESDQYKPFIAATKILERVVDAEKFYSKPSQKPSGVWPRKEQLETDDRIVEQLKYIPPNYDPSGKPKLIVFPGDTSSLASAPKRLRKEQCLVQNCEFSADKSDILKADAVLVKSLYGLNSYASLRHPRQVWIMSQLESPFHAGDYSVMSKIFNWTATYRRDSVLVTPYEKFVPFANFTNLPEKPPRDFARNKTKLIAWFVSNCNARNGRDKYVKELRKYIDVDIYGSCGELQCRRSDRNCDRMLSQKYKFYLSFENSNCKDYITEKLYWNAYLNDVVPIVMGARPEDYKVVAPPNSYIHVDEFESPAALAKYLLLLNNNDALYNSYFRWRGTGEFINTKFWCRICSLLHGAMENPFWYNNVQRWWHGPEVCTKPSENNDLWASWRKVTRNMSALVTSQFDAPVNVQYNISTNTSNSLSHVQDSSLRPTNKTTPPA